MTQEQVVRRVAVVLFDGFTVLDAYGPIQAFGSCRRREADGTLTRFYEIFSIGDRPGPVKSGEGPSTQADYAFGDSPPWDILLVPGGFGTREAVNNEPFLKRLAQASEQSKITTTVCTGSALLARTGLLDGRPATSNKMSWDWVIKQGPKVQWKRHARWVDDGDTLTSSGVSAGTDMALALVARLNGREMAMSAARGMEYLWNEDPSNDPFA